MPSRSWNTRTWPSVAGAGADPDHRHLELRHQRLGHRGGDRLEDDREAAHGLQRQRLLGDLRRPAGGLALGLVAAERGRRLRRQADVAHHRDPGADDRPRAVDRGAAALELDRVAAGLLDEALGVGDGLLVRLLVRAERHVADQERRAQAAADGGGQHQHLLHADGDGRVVAEHRHRRGVADEDEVDAGLLDHLAPKGGRRR